MKISRGKSTYRLLPSGTSLGKTEYLEFRFKNEVERDGSENNIKLGGQFIIKIFKVKHARKGGVVEDVTNKIGRGWMKWPECYVIKKVPLKKKEKFFKTVVGSAMIWVKPLTRKRKK